MQSASLLAHKYFRTSFLVRVYLGSGICLCLCFRNSLLLTSLLTRVRMLRISSSPGLQKEKTLILHNNLRPGRQRGAADVALPFCCLLQLIAKLLDVDGACFSMSKGLVVLHGGHADQEVSTISHHLGFQRTCVLLQLTLHLLWLCRVPFLEVFPLAGLNEKEFGLPCQGGGPAALKGLREIL